MSSTHLNLEELPLTRVGDLVEGDVVQTDVGSARVMSTRAVNGSEGLRTVLNLVDLATGSVTVMAVTDNTLFHAVALRHRPTLDEDQE